MRALLALLPGLLAAGCSFPAPDKATAPTGLSYATNPAVYVLGRTVAANQPTIQGVVDLYSVSPALPAGLRLDPSTGVVTGTPEVAQATTGYTISATNGAGTSSAVLFITINATGDVPGAPTQVAAVADVRSATVSWTAPSSTGGGPLTGYQVLVSPATPTALITVTGTTALAEGLANGTSYTFAVLALNAGGQSPASLPAAPVTTPDLPSAPLDVVGVAGNGLASLRWTAPALSGGRPVETYLVQATPPVAAAETSVVGTTGAVSGLTNGLTYTFQIVAVNAVGEGPPSAPSLPVTPILSACTSDATCVGSGWCQGGSCQPPYGLTLASGLAAADDGKIYVSGSVPLTVEVTGGAPIVQLALVAEGNLQVVGPPAYVFAWDTAGRPEGSHRVVATAVGGSRTYSSNVLEVVVDRTRPLPPTLTPMAASTNQKPVVLTGTAEPLSLLTVLDAGLAAQQVDVPLGGSWVAAVALAEGAHALTATATDRAGNRSTASAALALVVDWTAPPPPVIDPVASPRTSTALTLVGAAEADSMVEVTQDGVALAGSVRATGGRWAKALTFPGNGTYRLVATATDATGNRSFGSAPVVVGVTTLLAAPPTLVVASPTRASPVPATGTAQGLATVAVYEGARKLGEVPASGAGVWTMSLALAEGSHLLKANMTSGGATSPFSAEVPVLVDRTAPVVTSRSPAPGAAAASNLDWAAPITVQFSEAMAPATALAQENVGVSAGGAPQPKTLALSADGTLLTIQLTAPPTSPDLTVSLHGPMADLVGNALAPMTWGLVAPEWLELVGPFDGGAGVSGVEVRLTVDGQGAPAATFSTPSTRAGPGQVFARRWSGAAWQDLGQVGATLSGCAGGLMFDAAGVPAVVFDGTSLAGIQTVCAARWTGAAWDRTCLVGDPNPDAPTQECSTALDLGPTGLPFIAYRDSKNALQASAWDGAQWVGLNGASLAVDGDPVADLQVFVTASGGHLVGWSGALGISAWLDGSADPRLIPYPVLASRATFGPMRMEGSGQRLAGVVVDAAGRLTVQQYTCDATAGCTDAPTRWRALGGVLSGPGAAASSPTLVLDAAGYPVVAWAEGRTLHAKRWSGTAWQPLGGGSAGAADHLRGLTIAVGPAGQVVLVWTTALGGGTAVTAKRYNR